MKLYLSVKNVDGFCLNIIRFQVESADPVYWHGYGLDYRDMRFPALNPTQPFIKSRGFVFGGKPVGV
jgi:hypothetical protein